MTGAFTNTYVFLFCFAFGFLIAGKRQILTLSTRVILLAVVGCAASFALLPGEPYHSTFGVATVIANVLFVAFAAIDFFRWRASR